jgi:hypothetical protein
MRKASVFCLVLSRDLANQIVDRVKTSGFSNNDVSALFPDQDTIRDLAQEKSTRIQWRDPTPESQRAAWWTARRSGFPSIGALAIPGAGPFVAAGPIIFALSGAVAGSVRGGGLAGTLIGMGISEFEASLYESKIKEGNILISIHTENPDGIDRAKAILREAGAQDICTTGEAFTPKESNATGQARVPPRLPTATHAFDGRNDPCG